jgi:3-dehydroquinate dehydratase-2
MSKIIIINGPNLNLLGKREPDIYGHTSFEDFFEALKVKFNQVELEYFQSTVEGEIINKLHDLDSNFTAVILNAAGYTHTSVAISDAVAAIKIPVVEVHISNIFSREDYRNKSLISANCVGSISGFGLKSYELALQYFL